MICSDSRRSVLSSQAFLQNRSSTVHIDPAIMTPSKILVFSCHLWILKRHVSLIPVNTFYIVQLPSESFSNGTINLSFLSLVVLVLCVSVFRLVSKRFNKFTLLLFCVASKLRI